MTVRLHQIESNLKRAISQVLARGMADPRITGMISVTRVVVSPDLHDAYVYISVLPQKNEKKVLAGLRHGIKHLQMQVRQLVSMRFVPQLDLRLDEGIKKQAGVLDAIRRGIEREKPLAPTTEGNTAAESGTESPRPEGDAEGADPQTPKPTSESSSSAS